MVTINKIALGTVEIKGSKFLSFLMPISLYEEQLAFMQAEHPKAVHFVSASRYLNEYDQIIESSSDDGEPKGTSGKPTLAVLQGHDLINSAIITVRYFGGTKLGPGGLVRAYADAANAAYANAEIFPYEKLLMKKIECDFSNLSLVEYECTQKSVRIVEKEFGIKGVGLCIEGTKERLTQLLMSLDRLIQEVLE